MHPENNKSLNETKKHIAHIIDCYLPASENWIFNQIRGIDDYTPFVLTHTVKDPELFPIENLLVYNPNMTVKIISRLGKTLGLKNINLKEMHIKKIITRNNIGLVHCHFFHIGYRYLFLKKDLGIPLVLSLYGFDYKRTPNGSLISGKMYNELFHNADLLIVEGESGAKVLREFGCPEGKIKINHLGRDLSKIKFKARYFESERPVRLLQVASFREKKGHEYSIRALEKAGRKYPNMELTFIGNGESKEKMVKLVNDLHLESKISFKTGMNFDEMIKESYNYDIFIHPSIIASDGTSEGGAPVVLLDMQATGMPVISTRHCDIPEYVVDGKSAFLAREKDVDDLASKIIDLINSHDKWPEMGGIGRRHVEDNYSHQQMILNLKRIYDSLVP